MTSLRERCLFLTCKCNPSAVHFALGTMSPPPPPPLALTKRNAVHLLRMSRRTCLAHVCGMFCLPCWLHCSAVLLLAFLFFQQTVVGLQFLRLKIFTELSPIIFNLSLQVKDLSRSKCTLWCKLCFTTTLLDKISFFMK